MSSQNEERPTRQPLSEKELLAFLEIGVRQQKHDMAIQMERHKQLHQSQLLMVVYVILVLLIVLGFTGWCIYMGKELIIIEFLRYTLYPISAAAGFWAGRKTSHFGQRDIGVSSIDDTQANQ